MRFLKYEDFPLRTYDKVRYGDTDRQGHVNNANFSTFLETGRTEVLYHPDFPVLDEGVTFVIASLKLDFLREVLWPGEVQIGTGVLRMGRSSIRLLQQLFQNGECVAKAETVIVQVDGVNKQGTPLTEAAREVLLKWSVPSGE